MSKVDELIEKLCSNGVAFKKLEEITKSINIGINPRKFFKLNPVDSTGFYVTVRELNGLNGVKEYEKTDKINDEAIQIINNRANIEMGDILFSNTGTVGKLALINETPANWGVNEGIYIIKPIKEEILSKYLYYYLDSSHAYKDYSSKFTGSTLKHITQKALASLIVAVPPLEVQCEIVRILDDFTLLSVELSAELSAELKARKKQYEFYLHKLLEVKEGVELTIGEIYDFKYGTGNTIPSEGGEYPVYGSNGKVGYCKEYNSEDSPVIGHIGAYAGIVNWAEGKHFVTYNGVICKYKNKMVNKRYAYYLLLTQDFIGEQKGAQPFVSYDALKKPLVRIPNIEIQKSIVEKLDKLDKLCNDISEALPAEIEARQKQYEYYRDKLLTFKELKVNE